MNHTLHIRPRQSGKTTEMIHRFMENPLKSIIICHNNRNRKMILDKIRELYHIDYEDIIPLRDQIKPISSINKYGSVSFTDIDNIFIDEYLLYNSNEKLLLNYLWNRYNNFKSFICYSSLERPIIKEVFLTLREKGHLERKKLEEKYGISEVSYIADSFLGNHKFKIIPSYLPQYVVDKRKKEWGGFREVERENLDLYNKMFKEPKGIKINIEYIY